MANTKASDIFTLKKMIRDQGKELEKKLLDKLTPDAAKVYQAAVANNWVPIKIENEILDAAAGLLFPDESCPLRRMGYEVAKINFTGLYRVFLLVSTIPFVIKRVPQIWSTFFDQGEARVEELTAAGGTLIIVGLPELQAAQREYISGFVAGLLELAGASQVQIVKVEDDPNAWAWRIKWMQSGRSAQPA